MSKIYILLLVIISGLIIIYFVAENVNDIDVDYIESINSFDGCVMTGYPIMESYPRQCKTDDKTFIEDIGNELEKMDLIRIDMPRPNQIIESPLSIGGEARGYWFFEGDFPITLTDAKGIVIARGFASVKGEWMTEDFVQFEAVLKFEKPKSHKGKLILHKDNPSGLPENDDSLEVPVIF